MSRSENGGARRKTVLQTAQRLVASGTKDIYPFAKFSLTSFYCLSEPMAVYTEVRFEEAQQLLQQLGLGALQEFNGISSGIENTNYFATTSEGRYVLTVFERLSFDQLPFYLGLMKHLAQQGVLVPMPYADAHGLLVHQLHGKPTAVVQRLDGEPDFCPDEAHCLCVGEAMARMHIAGHDYALQQPHLRGLDWWAQTVPLILPYLNHSQKTLIETELALQHEVAHSSSYAQLPKGPIHADLFRDNVIFRKESEEVQLSGFFDFYFAGVDVLLFDLAVSLNDWCIDLNTGELVEPRAQTLMNAYHQRRPLNTAELMLLPTLMRGAALRFWISRLWDMYLPRKASLLQPHDPRHFERVLRCRVQSPWHYIPPGVANTQSSASGGES
jgi:homoserine kinase type II